MVESNIYIPIRYKITTGILVNTLLGSKNQNIPTPNVNSAGSINDKSVAFLPSPSKKDQTENKTDKITSTNKPINLY
jgi:hypothetical protein